MSLRMIAVAATVVLAATPLAGSAQAPDTGKPGQSADGSENFWGRICSFSNTEAAWSSVGTPPPDVPVAKCPAVPNGFQSLPSVGGNGGATSVNLAIGYDPDSKRLCFVSTGLPVAPVLRISAGHALSVQLANTLHDSGKRHDTNCPIDTFGGEGFCLAKPVFPEAPGPDGSFYPIMANQAHTADGTSNLHVHGLFVSPAACSDEVLASTIYPSNWSGKTGLLAGCQPGPDALDYTYQLPADHPAGAYWYHTHRHGQAEHQTQMGLAGAIVVEDQGDVWRRSIGVTDEVLLVTDVPNPACLVGPSCDNPATGKAMHANLRQPDGAAARIAARQGAAQAPAANAAGGPGVLDPRIDQADQAGECAYGSSNDLGGVELWTLLLNGAQVAESQSGFPPDGELLTKTMQPGQRQIFRLVNAAANSFVAPELVLSQNGVQTVQKLEVFARDGVGLADEQGGRRFGYIDVATNQLIVPPAGRVEFVVHAPPPGATLYLQSSQVAPGCGGNAYPARRLLLINSAGTPVAPGPADDSDLLANTPSLLPYLSTLSDTATVHRSFVLAEYGRDFTYGSTDWLKTVPSPGDFDGGQTDFFLTEVASDDGSVNPLRTALKPFTGHNLAPQVVVHLHGRPSVTEEWLVQNSTLEIHTFHMHQIHVRVTGDSQPSSPDLQALLDVVNVPAAKLVGDVQTGYPGAPGWVKLKMTFTRLDIGEFVYHCHIMEHEDNGMMGKIRVVAD